MRAFFQHFYVQTTAASTKQSFSMPAFTIEHRVVDKALVKSNDVAVGCWSKFEISLMLVPTI